MPGANEGQQPADQERWNTQVLNSEGKIEPYNPAKHDITPAKK